MGFATAQSILRAFWLLAGPRSADVLVSLFVRDTHSARADRTLRSLEESLAVSDFAAAEFASGIAQHVRVAARDARTIFSEFDEWTAREALRVELTHADAGSAAALLRRLDSPLRTPDALHVAVARRLGARLMIFGKATATAARGVGVEVVGV